MIVNPIVQIGRDINARWIHKDNIIPQKTATFAGPKDAHQAALAELLLAQSIRQLFNVLERQEGMRYSVDSCLWQYSDAHLPPHWASRRSPPSLDMPHRHHCPPPDRNNWWYDLCHWAESSRATWHWWRSSCHWRCVQRRPPSCDPAAVLRVWLPPYRHSSRTIRALPCPQSLHPHEELRKQREIEIYPEYIYNKCSAILPLINVVVSSTYSSISP